MFAGELVDAVMVGGRKSELEMRIYTCWITPINKIPPRYIPQAYEYFDAI